MHEHLSRRAARRHDLGLIFAGIAAAAAPAPRVQPPPKAQPPQSPAALRPEAGAPVPRRDAN